jgi:DNA-binding NtrC family response regulator
MPSARQVLVVDDEENIRLFLHTLLQKKGYSVRTAETAEQALTLLRQAPADFVLTDVKMPGMSGIDLCRELRGQWPELVVVVMSAYGSVEQALEAVRVGAYDYVSKPFKQEEVLFAKSTSG